MSDDNGEKMILDFLDSLDDFLDELGRADSFIQATVWSYGVKWQGVVKPSRGDCIALELEDGTTVVIRHESVNAVALSSGSDLWNRQMMSEKEFVTFYDDL